MIRVLPLLLCTFFLLVASAWKPVDIIERFGEQLSALKPSEPIAYFELAEDILDAAPGDQEAMRLARWLYGIAGRLEIETYGSSAALAIAELTRDDKERMRLRAAAMMLDPQHEELLVSASGAVVDAETAFDVSESFGGFRSGRGQRLRRLLTDPSRRELLLRLEEQLPDGGLPWLDRASKSSRGRPDLSQDKLVQMLRIEVRLLEGAAPSWSSEALGGGAMPLLQIKRDEIEELLGGNPDRPYWRNGGWVGIQEIE